MAPVDTANTRRDGCGDRGCADREARPKAGGFTFNEKPGKESRRNRRIARSRARVERVFAGLEQLGGKALLLNWKAAT